MRSFRLLALLLACSPCAFANFPPCPRSPVDLYPIDSGTLTTSTPWFAAGYAQLGNRSPTRAPSTGKCDDRAAAAEARISPDSFSPTPVYAPNTQFGVIALPELPRITTPGLRMEYTLDFKVDTAQMASYGDWIDLVQLEFLRSSDNGAPAGSNPSVFYRIRKQHMGKDKTQQLVLIESRPGTPLASGATAIFSTIVAKKRQYASEPPTTLRLRWTQQAALAPTTDFNGRDRYVIDSIVELFGAEGKSLFRASLPGQWANGLSIGAIDYTAQKDPVSTDDPGILLSDIWLSAESL
jgi:hypothetical protein